MVARSFDSTDRRVDGPGRGVVRRGRSVGGATGYRVDVVGAAVADVVFSTGGWLFDRAMAGWLVNVFVDRDQDFRPLNILGARGRHRSEFSPMVVEPRTRVLAVAADVLTHDEQVRQGVLLGLDQGLSEVALWGDHRSVELSLRARPVAYELSFAARAFKARALTAAALEEPVGSREGFHRAVGRFLCSRPL